MGLMTFRTIAFGALLVGSTAGATGLEKALLSTNATCNCKGPGDCTCPKGQCKCKKCGNGAKPGTIIKTLQGSSETTRLPDTARHDAHGGVFI
ncbi:MAG: hypothetical protein IT380_07355 [Myxococcales bacterium]|nr:hypothetical protein [Myxococcales bacterium]